MRKVIAAPLCPLTNHSLSLVVALDTKLTVGRKSFQAVKCRVDDGCSSVISYRVLYCRPNQGRSRFLSEDSEMRVDLGKRHFVAVAAILLLVFVSSSLFRLRSYAPAITIAYGRDGCSDCHANRHNGTGENAKWQRPAHIRKVMGLLFYGRRSTVSILDCYLKVLGALETIRRES